jgi:2-amino-4-hydroxy-6-hydroxymethyldihydropteridine diphosphokinase
MNRAVIGVGSNINPGFNIPASMAILQRELRLVASSKLVTSKPVGPQDQPDFVNAAFLVETPLDRHAFRAYLKEVEDRLGRVRGPDKSGPRTIDLDTVVWNGLVVDEDFYSRDYLRSTVLEVAPELLSHRVSNHPSPQ